MYVIATFKGLQQTVADLGRISTQSMLGVESVLDEVALLTAMKMSQGAPKSRATGGALSRSMEVIERRAGLRKIGPGGGMGSSENPLPKAYAIYVEDGSGAHWPSVKGIGDRMGLDKNEAFLVARAISRRSMLPVNFAENTFNQIIPIFQSAVESMMAKVVS